MEPTPALFSSGILFDPNVHDALLLGVECKEQTLLLKVEQVGAAKPICLVVQGVEALVCTPFLAGNIVFGITYVGGDVSSTDREARFRHTVTDTVVAEFTTYYGEIARFPAWLFLSSSYGAEIVAAGAIRPEDISCTAES